MSIETAKQSSKVVLLEPRTYSEAQGIADHLKGRRAVVINLQRMSTDQAVRIVDFLSGTVYAIGGDIQKIGPKTFMCTPENVDIVGAISELFGEEEDKYKEVVIRHDNSFYSVKLCYRDLLVGTYYLHSPIMVSWCKGIIFWRVPGTYL